MKNIITVNQVNFTYTSYKKLEGFLGIFKREKKEIQALRNFSMRLNEGEILGLLGLNGAGKTTLIKLLTGILNPNKGKIEVLETSPFKKEKTFLKQIGVMFGQKSQLIWDLPPINTLTMLCEIYGLSHQEFKERLDFFVKKLNIEEQLYQPVRKLSLGQRIKFELICSLIHNPKIVFLDEPTIGVDIPSKMSIYDFLLELNRNSKTTIILTSHDSQDIEVLAKHIVILNNGIKIFDGSKNELKNKYMRNDQLEVTTNREVIDVPKNVIKIGPLKYRLNSDDFDKIGIPNSFIVNIKRVGSDLNDILMKILTA